MGSAGVRWLHQLGPIAEHGRWRDAPAAWHSLRMIDLRTVGLASAALLAAPVGANAASSDRITICHGVGAEALNRISVAPQAVINGHAGRHPRDVIPPFAYGRGESFPGQNWDQTGILTWLNGCKRWIQPEPPEPPEPPPPPPPPPPPNPWPPVPVIKIAPVTFCLVTPSGHVVRTEKPLATARLITANPTSVVPPFSFTVNERVYTYPGYNWGPNGQSVWYGGCAVPAVPAVPAEPAVPESRGSEEPLPDSEPRAQVAVVITPSTYRPRPGSVVRFSVRGSAAGSEPAFQTRMCAQVPRSMKVVTVINGRQRGQSVCWQLPAILSPASSKARARILGRSSGQASRARYFTARVDPRVSGVLINARAAIDATNTRPARSMTTLYPKVGLPPVTG